MKKIMGVVLVSITFILVFFAHNNIYSIPEKSIEKYICKSLYYNGENFKILKEEYVSGTKAIVFSTCNDNSKIGIALLNKGLNNQYSIERIINGSQSYTIYKNYLFKEYLIEVGDNRDGYLSYIGTKGRSGDLQKISIEKDFFIKFININKFNGYNFYNYKNEIVDI